MFTTRVPFNSYDANERDGNWTGEAGTGSQAERDCSAELCQWEVTEVTCRRSAGTRWTRRRHHDDRAGARIGGARQRALVRIEFVLRARRQTAPGKRILVKRCLSVLSLVHRLST